MKARICRGQRPFDSPSRIGCGSRSSGRKRHRARRVGPIAGRWRRSAPQLRRRSNLGIKATVENEVADSVYKALAPYLGNMNFRVSVQADINTDQKQIEETIFDPESRVERSVQVVRSEDAASQQTGNTPATSRAGPA
jgi:hypothetical protein